MQRSWESSLSASSSSFHVPCARLVSTSPPDASRRLSPTPSARTDTSVPIRSPQPGPAVLHVSEEIWVDDMEPPPGIEAGSSALARNSWHGPKSPSSATSSTFRRNERGSGTVDAERSVQVVSAECRRNCRSVCTTLIGVSLLVVGGLVVPGSWVALGRHLGSSAGCESECCRTGTQLNFVFIAQGLLLLLTGVLMSCWNRMAARLYLDSMDSSTPKQVCSCLFSILTVSSYAGLLASLSFITWQLMSSSVYCDWPFYMYMVLALTEVLAVVLCAVALGVVCITCSDAFCRR